MNENVIFNQNTQNTDPNDPPTQEMPPQTDGEGGEPPTSDDPPADEVDETSDTPPPPSGIAAILANSLIKKILIGLGILIVVIIIIVLIIPKKPDTKNVTLVWWGLWEDKATMQPLIDEFQKQNPNIKIEYIKQDPNNYHDRLLTRMNNGTGPDIFRYHNTWTPAITNILAPLPNDIISVKDFNKIYYPAIQKDLLLNGAIYGVPIGVDSLAMFVNTDLLKAAGVSTPKDWNQFIDAAKKLTVKDKDTSKIKTSGAGLGTYGNIMHAPDIISVMFLQQGVDQRKIDTSSDDLKAALTFYTSFAKGNDAVWDNSLDNSELAFAKGELAMYFGFSWDIFTIEQLKTNNKLNYEIHPVPSLTGGKSITVASYWVEGVSAKSPNQKEALIFIKYLTQKETLQRLYTESSKTRAFGELYPRIDMADELKSNALVYPFVSQLQNAGSSFFVSNTLDGDTGLNKRVNSYLENAINAIINDNSSSDTEVPKLQEGVKKVLLENGIQ
jgi:multiple sugar transport system substrate-binding protein